ncbi:hypothetical protein [Frankia sp. QA3]|uniref:hypothetical protein n=1 Tax=Frankia sp. QA3 TaxID=710111 RepID=UPI000563A6A5|nr:hypothetical protein [Frankia sp. QA3]
MPGEVLERTAMPEEPADRQAAPTPKGDPEAASATSGTPETADAETPDTETPDAESAPPTGIEPDAASGPDPAASEAEAGKSTRPVDWDGSFTRTWNARDDRQWSNRRAAEQESEWAYEQLQRLRRETLEQMNTESDREEARLRDEQARAASAGGRTARGTAAEELLRKLDKLDRFSPEESEIDGSADPDSPADPR